MRLRAILSFSISISLSLTIACSTPPSSKKTDCQTIIDSAHVFIHTSEFGVNIRPTIIDSKRNLRLDQWLQQLNFQEFKCLLDHQSASMITLGFLYASRQYQDSLMKYYSHLLTDTTPVQMILYNGRSSPEMPMGIYISKLAEKIEKEKQDLGKQPEIEAIVSQFIRQYASYPESYEPISFPYFSMGADESGVTHYQVRHEYKIKTNTGRTEKVISAFVLDKYLRINVIQKDKSSYILSIPPKMDYWLNEFGRKLTAKDSLELKFK